MENKTIIISIDNYEEVFDDFDPSDISERAFSHDFIFELRRRTEGIYDPVVLVLTIPSKLRKKRVEDIILKRLKQLFRKKRDYFKKKYNEVIKRGIIYVSVGVSLLLISSYIELTFTGSISLLFSNFLLIPSWFFVWSGLDKILESSSSFKRKSKFFDLLYRSKIIFDKEEKYES